MNRAFLLAACLWCASCGDSPNGPSTQPICDLFVGGSCPEPRTSTTTIVPTTSVATTTVPTSNALTLSVQPDPATAALAPDTEFTWRYSVRFIVTENEGVGGTLNSITHSHVNSLTGRQTDGFTRDADVIIENAGTNRIAARGSLTVPLTTLLRLTPEPPEAGSILRLNFTDERGNVLEFVVESTVILPPTMTLRTRESRHMDAEASGRVR
jgi:hypothetical protein